MAGATALLCSAAAACARSDAPRRAEGRTIAEGVVTERQRADEAVRSVFPLHPAPDARARRLCDALQQRPAERRAACGASSPGTTVTSECVRMLSAALADGAVTLADGDVDRCVAATDRALAGCDWAGPLAPPPPRECQDIVHGARTETARCRSSLECTDGLRCAGVGPTSPGVCAPPRADGQACGGSVDALAAYARQNGYDREHPECDGWCDGRRCAPRVAAGGACERDPACVAGWSCVGRRCIPEGLSRAPATP